MPRTIVELTRLLPYRAADICGLVGDVTNYHRFIPWVKSITVRNRVAHGEGWRGLAEAKVGWGMVQETFATEVSVAPDLGAVDVRLHSGPFRFLENRWRFADQGEHGAKVHFWIAYEFKNPVLGRLAHLNREKAASRILAAFEAEAARRFTKL